MLVKIISTSALALLLLCLPTACHKAGSGGDAEVSIFVKHHTKLIPGAVVYIKYNEKEFPGKDINKYDAKEICGNQGEALGHTHFKHLKYGYYYFYSTGFDSSISQTVSGGVGLNVKYSQRKSEKELIIPVTE